LLVTVAVGACQGLPQQTGFIATSASINVSAGEIRVRAVQLGRLFSAEIERAADSIRAVTAEPSIRRHALLWKMYAIPAAQEAVLLPDPAPSIVDAWAFARSLTTGRSLTLVVDQLMDRSPTNGWRWDS